MTDTPPNPKSPKAGIPDEVRMHFRAARKEMRAGIRALLPPGAVEHGRKARREMLLAWRGVIDAVLQRLEEEDKD